MPRAAVANARSHSQLDKLISHFLTPSPSQLRFRPHLPYNKNGFSQRFPSYRYVGDQSRSSHKISSDLESIPRSSARGIMTSPSIALLSVVPPVNRRNIRFYSISRHESKQEQPNSAELDRTRPPSPSSISHMSLQEPEEWASGLRNKELRRQRLRRMTKTQNNIKYYWKPDSDLLSEKVQFLLRNMLPRSAMSMRSLRYQHSIVVRVRKYLRRLSSSPIGASDAVEPKTIVSSSEFQEWASYWRPRFLAIAWQQSPGALRRLRSHVTTRLPVTSLELTDYQEAQCRNFFNDPQEMEAKVRQLVQTKDNPPDMQAWTSRPLDILLWSLHYSPSDTFKYLNAAVNAAPSLFSNWVLADVFNYLYNIMMDSTAQDLHRKLSARREWGTDYVTTLLKLLDHRSEFKYHLDSSYIRKAMGIMTIEQKIDFFKKTNDVWFVQSGFLNFAMSMAEAKRPDLAALAIQRMLDSINRPDRAWLRRSCVKMLRYCLLQSDGYRTGTELAAKLLQMGIPFDSWYYDALIHNAAEANDIKTVISLHKILQDQGMEPQLLSFRHLLNACRQSGDLEAVRELADLCGEKARQCADIHLSADYIVYLWDFYVHRQETAMFDKLLETFEKLFTTTSLYKLGMISEDYRREILKQVSISGERSPHPPPKVLFIMLVAYLWQYKPHLTQNLKTLPEFQRSDMDCKNELVRLYLRFQKYVHRNDYSIAPLATTHQTYNLFLKAFCMSKNLLLSAPAILTDMMKPIPPPRNPNGKQFINVTPSIKTWNILLRGYMMHRQPEAGQKVLELMRQRNMEPDQESWNSIIRGHAYMQNEERTAHSLMEAEEQGFDTQNEGIMAALSKIKFKNKLLDTIKKMEKERRSRKDFEVDMESSFDLERLDAGLDKMAQRNIDQKGFLPTKMDLEVKKGKS
jgi:pentatricopeptide repeat protein